MANDFLPADYSSPVTGDNYYKLVKGENRFRFISSPITGWVWWTEDKEGNKKPSRIRMSDVKPDPKLKAKHFWAAVVYDYSTRTFKIFEITQKSIQVQILSLNANEKWGSPKDYDLCIVRSGDGMETEYNVQPEPKTPVPEKEKAANAFLQIELEVLYAGGDPFEHYKP